MVCVTSGKGGTGKSFLTSNLAVLFAEAGLNTFVVDADLGLANLHLLLDIIPRTSLYQVAVMGLPVWEAAQRGPGGIWFLPGGSGLQELANLRASEIRFLVSRLRKLRRGLDVVLVDTAAGIAHQTTSFLAAADLNVVVTTPDLTALTDAYAVIKTIHQINPNAGKALALNRVRDEAEGNAIFDRVAGITMRFLRAGMKNAGSIPEDGSVRLSVARKCPVVVSAPSSAAAGCLRSMAHSLALGIQELRARRARAAEAAGGRDQEPRVAIPDQVFRGAMPRRGDGRMP